MSEESLFSAQFLRELEQLNLLARQTKLGRYAGARRSPKKGTSVEFADFRNYSWGDDFRQIDWTAYARLEKLFLKLFFEEQDTCFSFFIDTSASMDWGEPHKGRSALRMAGALAYLGLLGQDRVGIGTLRDGLGSYLRPVRSRSAIWRVFEFLESVSFGGKTELNRSLRDFGKYRPGHGVSVVFSDLLAEGGYEDGLRSLLALGQEVTVVQLLAPEEIQPALIGDLRLQDRETGSYREVTITPGILKAYAQRLEIRRKQAQGFCQKHGMTYAFISVGDGLLPSLFGALRGTLLQAGK